MTDAIIPFTLNFRPKERSPIDYVVLTILCINRQLCPFHMRGSHVNYPFLHTHHYCGVQKVPTNALNFWLENVRGSLRKPNSLTTLSITLHKSYAQDPIKLIGFICQIPIEHYSAKYTAAVFQFICACALKLNF